MLSKKGYIDFNHIAKYYVCMKNSYKYSGKIYSKVIVVEELWVIRLTFITFKKLCPREILFYYSTECFH